MKKGWVFVLGSVTGIVITLGFLFVIATISSQQGLTGLTIFDEPGECLSKSDLEVFQVIEANAALAKTVNRFDLPVYLVVNREGKTYYDDQIIKLPAKKCFRQIGTYQYKTNSEFRKTVPVVEIN